GHGRALQVEGGALLRAALELPTEKHPGEIARAPGAVDVRHHATRDSGLEALGVPDDPGAHVTPVGASRHAKPALVYTPLGDGVVQAGHDVFIVHAAPVIEYGVGEALPVALAAPGVGVKHDAAPRG